MHFPKDPIKAADNPVEKSVFSMALKTGAIRRGRCRPVRMTDHFMLFSTE
jgi:hypothetical protein